MDREKIGKEIKHLKQWQVVVLLISATNKILVERGITTEEELLERFLSEMKRKGWQKKIKSGAS